MANEMIKGARILLECLSRLGIKEIFGYPGGAVIPIYDELYSFKDIKHYFARHEQGAVHEADGYARSTGKVGVCLATSGPGATNLVTGIMTAHMDSIPLLAITGQVTSTLLGKDAFQESDIVGITVPITKNNYLVQDIRELPRILKEAYYIASTGRPGPVLVDIPRDIQLEEIPYDEFKKLYEQEFELEGYNPVYEGHKGQIKTAIKMIKDSKKPLIIAGAGILKGHAYDELKEFVSWASEVKRMNVRMNADTAEDVEQGKSFGAKGIGLCRTEHMFFKNDKIWTIREFILSDRGEEKERALKKLHNLQKEDFLNIFEVLDGDEANIRLLDPPVHEFLPKTTDDKKKMAEILLISLEEIEKRIYKLKDENPMLGHRGCRLGVSYPELYRIQARAIIEAAYECEKKGIKVHPEIMIPFIMESKELAYLRKEIEEEIESFFKEVGATVEYKLGTMIEIPRACLLADEIAEYADFFSFGTNDLTQMSMGLSRDDSVKFLDDYRERGIWEGEPFYSIDTKAVTKLVEIGVKNGKSVKPNLQIGVCGEHGGDTKSIEFFEGQKFDYVSCSPFRVPTAILAAAQSYLKLKK